MRKDKTPLKLAAAAAAGVAAVVTYTSTVYHAVAKRKSLVKPHDKTDETDLIYTQSFDGLKLAAHWSPAESPKRIIIAMHGWRSSWERDFGDISGFLNRSGCSVLFAEQRSHGSSEGNYISYGILERHDVVSWADYIKEHYDTGLPVYLYGISMGAATVLMTVNLDFPLPISGIIADCGYNSAEDIIKNTAKSKKIPASITYPVIDRRFERELGHSFSELNIPDLMKNNTIPTLFIHGDADTFVPLSMTMENYEACAAPKELLIVEGAAHAKSYITDPERYEGAVSDFFEKYDVLSISPKSVDK